jgi:hypothetical protein
MAKVPRIGPEHSRLCDVLGKLATPSSTLDDAERAWLVELLDSMRLGEDVSRRFTRNAKLSPEAERHFWIACDVARHIHDGLAPAHDLVAQRWKLKLSDAESARKIAQRQRPNTDEITRLLDDPGFPNVIEWHRAKLLTVTHY